MNHISPLKLSILEARKIALFYQRIHKKQTYGSGEKGTLAAIEHLGYVQIDSISVVERAHHHCLWSRVNHYQPDTIDNLLKKKKIFEYWAHAAAYLPMRDYRFSIPRKKAISAGESHWFIKNPKLADYVLKRIETDGPLQAKDFKETPRKTSGWWDWKPAKIALELLFMEGKLMVVKRLGFQKVYDLTGRVLPASIDTSTPSDQEYCRYLIRNYLTAHGLGTVEEMGYLRKGMNRPLGRQCEKMLAEGQLITVKVDNKKSYFALPGALSILDQSLGRSKVQILSPFDNLIIQRKRLKEIFNFDYSLECYLPAEKRRYGYFCLPLLWGQRFAGRMDVKMQRNTGLLTIPHLHLETDKVDKFLYALRPSLKQYLNFNKGSQIQIGRISKKGKTYPRETIEQFKQILKT